MGFLEQSRLSMNNKKIQKDLLSHRSRLYWKINLSPVGSIMLLFSVLLLGFMGFQVQGKWREPFLVLYCICSPKSPPILPLVISPSLTFEEPLLPLTWHVHSAAILSLSLPCFGLRDNSFGFGVLISEVVHLTLWTSSTCSPPPLSLSVSPHVYPGNIVQGPSN